MFRCLFAAKLRLQEAPEARGGKIFVLLFNRWYKQPYGGMEAFIYFWGLLKLSICK